MSHQRLGPYEITKTLGQGGMGTVYEAVDRTTNEQVALKVLAPNSADDDQLRGRFAAEIEALKRLKHPNIVGIVGYGEQDGALYFSMELVKGKSLFDELRSGRRFHWHEVVRMGIDICEGLRHAHDRGIIHRDLKPGNLLLAEDEKVKLTDFGIAKLFGGEQRTAHGGVIGTAEYMSPEQAQGQPVTMRSDLYSFGCVLYTLLARRPPFESASLTKTIKNLTQEKPPRVQDVAPNTPPELARLIDRLLEKKPEDRIGTALSLSNRLKAIADEIDEHDTDVVTPAIDEDEPDPNRTHVPDTVKARRATEGKPRSPKPRKDAVLPSFVSTEIPPTVLEGQTGAEPAELESLSDPVPQDAYQVIDEVDRQAAQRIPSELATHGPIWPYAVGLIVLVAVGTAGVIYSMTPKSADTLYAEIEAASGEADQLYRFEDELREFVDRFADDRRIEEVREYLTFVESSKYPRRLEQRARLRGTSSLSPCQRDYLAALRTADVDPEEAARQLETLLAIYGNLETAPPDVAQCVDSVRMQLVHLQPIVKRYVKQQKEIVQQCLVRASQLAARDAPTARQTLAGVIRRYGDKAWAADSVARAREMIDTMDKK